MQNDSSSSDNNSKKSNSNMSSPKKNNENNNSPRSNEEEEQLINYYEYINTCLSNNEENRQNYFNNLEELKSKINNIKSKNLKNNEYAIILLDEFIKLSDEHYSLFSNTKEILIKFNDLNDAAQNLLFIHKKNDFSTSYFIEMSQKNIKDLEKKDKEIENLRKTIKDLNTIEIQNQNIIQSMKENNKEIKTERNNNIEIKRKMDNLIEENQELKRKYSQIMSESQLFKNFVDQEYIPKQESSRRMSSLFDKIDLYEKKIDNLQNKLNEKEKEKEKEKEIEQNKINEKENIIDLESPKSYISDNNSEKGEFNLEELLVNQDPDEEEEKSAEEDKKIEEEDNKLENKINPSKNQCDNEMMKNFLTLCPINPINQKENNNKKINNLKSHIKQISFLSSQSSQLNDIKKRKNAKSVHNRSIQKKDLKKSYKIFFFLLLKSITINYNIEEHFQKKDFESLFEECQNENIPFYCYLEWIQNKINIFNVDSLINDCFICSSMI